MSHTPQIPSHNVLTNEISSSSSDPSNTDSPLTPASPPSFTSTTPPVSTTSQASTPIWGSRSPSPSSSSNQEPHLPQNHIHLHATSSELPALRRQHETEGYRSGVSAGRADPEVAQGAFDSGYGKGAGVGVRVGWVLGSLRALGRREDLRLAEGELGLGGFLAILENGGGEREQEVQGEEVEKEGEKEGGKGLKMTKEVEWEALDRWTRIIENIGREKGVELGWPG